MGIEVSLDPTMTSRSFSSMATFASSSQRAVQLATGLAAVAVSSTRVPLNLALNAARPVARGPANLGDIADAVRTLPDLLAALSAIDSRTRSLDSEVAAMRASVDQIHGEIRVLTSHVDGVESSLHPLGRLRKRMTKPVAEGDNGAPA